MKLLWDVKEAKRRGADGIPGWPASDHEEPDEKLAREKIRTGLYSKAPEPVKKAEKEVDDGHGS